MEKNQEQNAEGKECQAADEEGVGEGIGVTHPTDDRAENGEEGSRIDERRLMIERAAMSSM